MSPPPTRLLPPKSRESRILEVSGLDLAGSVPSLGEAAEGGVCSFGRILGETQDSLAAAKRPRCGP